MHRQFTQIYTHIAKNRLPWLIATIAILGLCAFMVTKIRFDEDISQIIPKSDKADITAKVLRQQNFSDKIIVIIESGGAENFELSETADAFLERLKPLEQRFIKKIDGRVDETEIAKTFDFVNAHLPLFLDENDYKILDQKLQPDSISRKMAENYEAMLSPTSLVTKDFIKKDPLGLSAPALQKLSALSFSKDFKLEDNYILTKDGRHILLFIEPKFGGSETKNNEKFVAELDKIKEDLNQKFLNKTKISYFGSPVIAVANAKQIKSDIQKTVLISMLILFALLIFYFKNIFTPLIVFIPTAVSVVISLAFMYLIRDRISAISLSIGAILLGITIDYALHILTHYKHKANIAEVYREITAPILMSSATTAASFLCLIFVKSEALKDLGIFAAVTVMLSAVLSLIIIPHIYSPKNSGGQPAKNTIVDKIGAYPYERNRWMVYFCAFIVVLSFFGFNKIRFNNNIADLNFVPKEMQENEAKLRQLSDIADKSIYAVAYGNTQQEALSENSKLANFLQQEKKSGKILNYSSTGQIILPNHIQREKIADWNRFWTPERKNLLLNQIKSEAVKNGFNPDAFADFENLINSPQQTLSVNDFSKLNALQASQFLNQKDGLYTATSIIKIDENKRDAVMKSIEKSNPKVLAIDRQQMNENFLGLLKNDFNSLINYSLIAVVIIFFIFFRNIDLTLFAVVPIVLSGVVTAGILYFLGLELNIFSTIVCTLVFGAGVDFNIFLTQALQKELTTGKSELPTYRVSIILALLTTVLAIGALIFAKHPALKSVSSVALVGMLAVTVISLTLYPLLFDFQIKRTKTGLAPVSVRTMLNSVFSLIYYALGGFFFSFFGSFIKKSNAGKLDFVKKCMAGFLKSVLYTNPFVKKNLIKNPDEDFSKPAIIIANHTSFLDTLALAMATHKVVYLVNDWVFNSKIFGKLVKALGYFPVAQGIENGLDPLEEKIKQGYSLVVFPEAERSMDNKIKRFHKGAFYLAEKYNLDILPIYIHGNAEVMPKNDFMIHDGKITVKVGDRLPASDASLGKNYSERTKRINAIFREKYAGLRNEIEDENYFKHALYSSFLFKENEIVSAVKKDFNINKTAYRQLGKILSSDEKILHICGDYGQTDVLLKLQEPGREIFSFINDKNRLDIAKQNYVAIRRNIHYINALSDEKFDCLLITADTIPAEINLSDFQKIIVFKSDLEIINRDFELVSDDGNIRIYTKL